jgi:hypothetical protein
MGMLLQTRGGCQSVYMIVDVQAVQNVSAKQFEADPFSAKQFKADQPQADSGGQPLRSVQNV